ncbi:MAG: hypothetical protein HZA52_10800 [Planctomycetes bacterium]|nr:hypothetical protein [Planctomycetota bacterium]
MDHRLGTCSACSARYQIPATFPHSRAKCRTCGGVVEIGPVVGAKSARSASKALTTPATTHPATDAERAPRTEPQAERPSAARAPVAGRATPPTPQPDSPIPPRATPKPPDAPLESTPAPKPAAAKPESAARSAPERAARDPKAAADRQARDAKAAAATEPESKSKLVPIALGALMLTAAVIAAFFYNRGERDDSAHAAPPSDAPQDQERAPLSGAQPGAQPAAQPGSQTDAPAPRELDRDLADSASVDLSALADLATPELRASAEGTTLDSALQRFLAAATTSERETAARELVAAGRPALLFALDAWKRLDLATDDGRADATALERDVVTALAGGRSFGWKADGSAESRLFGARVIAQWHRVAGSDDAWQRFLASAATH